MRVWAVRKNKKLARPAKDYGAKPAKSPRYAESLTLFGRLS
ncbi:hypothetical protein CAMSH0001_0720 [Campylobacter showae RM3277]|uniref:Uncharacterized protein n=1 Tax=Campylobacter showae RM3277 TaxID=553219 RepID=C6RH93_9BACT|nr:hypothetical protein CAMSH0001_0720 [Campylobacter showae RM3277]